MVRRRAYAVAVALLLLSLVAALAVGDVDRSLRAAAFWGWVRDAALLGGLGLGLARLFVPVRDVPAPDTGIDYYA